MFSDEIDSLGLFTVGFKTLQSYIMNVWHQISVAQTAGAAGKSHF